MTRWVRCRVRCPHPPVLRCPCCGARPSPAQVFALTHGDRPCHRCHTYQTPGLPPGHPRV